MRYVLIFFLSLLLFQTISKHLEFVNGKYKIVQFTDLHYGESSWKDAKTNAMQKRIIELESPDLVVLSGDAITGYWGQPTIDDVEKRWKYLTDPMREANVPWAFCNGNHDDEGPLTSRQIVDLDFKLGGLSRNGKVVPGSSNYYLEVYSGNEIATYLWFFDSMNQGCHGLHGWGCVPLPVVTWYNAVSARLRAENNGTVPGIAFVHIPLPELMAIYNYSPVDGVKKEKSGCSVSNTGLFQSFETQKSVKGLFSGHDHKNDYLGHINDITLAYGRKSGFGGYQSELEPGARIIELQLNPFRIHSWIRQHDDFMVPPRIHKPDPQDVQLHCDLPAPPEEESWIWLIVCIILVIAGSLLVIFLIDRYRTVMKETGRKMV